MLNFLLGMLKALASLPTRIFGSRNQRLIKQYSHAVAQINALEPAMEKLSDEALKAKTGELKKKFTDGATLDALLPEAFAVVREASKRDPAHAPLRRAADRRHGPARRQDRRDEDRRGQDPGGDAARLPERAHRAGRPHRHRQRLPRQPRRGVDGEDLQRSSASASASTCRTWSRATSAPPTPPTSPTAPTTSSASTTCATTWRCTSRSASSAACATPSSTRWTRS